MRIWYQQPIIIPHQPEDVEIMLCGIMNECDGSKSLIEIQLVADDQVLILYSHNPTMRFAEEPTDDELIAKYNAKLVRLRLKAQKTDFSKLFPSV